MEGKLCVEFILWIVDCGWLWLVVCVASGETARYLVADHGTTSHGYALTGADTRLKPSNHDRTDRCRDIWGFGEKMATSRVSYDVSQIGRAHV